MYCRMFNLQALPKDFTGISIIRETRYISSILNIPAVFIEIFKEVDADGNEIYEYKSNVRIDEQCKLLNDFEYIEKDEFNKLVKSFNCIEQNIVRYLYMFPRIDYVEIIEQNGEYSMSIVKDNKAFVENKDILCACGDLSNYVTLDLGVFEV